MPTEPLNCLESLVGLAPAALPCFPLPSGDTDWITASSRAGSAGGAVYVSQLAGLNFQPAKADPPTDVYDRLGKARNSAAAYVRTAIQQARGYGFGAALFSASGQLGKAGNGSVYQGAAALTLTTNYVEGGGYKVTALALQTTVTVADVAIQLDGVTVATITTNAPLQSITPFVIPFDGAVHQLVPVGLPDGVRPLTGQLFCTTGCNSMGPGTFGGSVARGLSGVTSSTPNAGFLLRVQEVCTAEDDVLCYATTASAELADSLARAVQAMAGYYFLMDLFSQANYSRYTLLDQKQMDYLANTQFKPYADQMIAWLSQPQGLGRLKHPCYTCQPNPYGPRLAKTA
ncbi:hypothetical protein [Hymenobacter properus]|uniref:Uncharacterized protein n=1 Tax=Hymenobacter properus TaxID=2791026 RepID=A0A931BGI5_9BACT|nr:hypothetical protein [Hymenobacter properus]MBF9140842.1 hypothetical protein [Hymenobacter properus]MBR7719651.1 hypothetical protein [Microvirga sp. SRT04]